MLRHALIVSAVAACATAPAAADLNQFDISDGYMGAFATSVWTYNPLWSFDGGALGSNYVSQHGYGAGGAFGAPFGLVVRNDNPAGNYRFSYDFTSFDLGGANPNSISGPGQNVTISFDVQPVFHQNNTVTNNTPMLTMAFGGTAVAPGVKIGFADDNSLMYSDAAGNLQTYTANPISTIWHRIALTIHFDTSLYDLTVTPLLANPGMESSTFTPITTWTVGTGLPMANSLTSMQSLYWEVFTQPENGLGWHKGFFDNFQGGYVPAPGAVGLLALGALAVSRRRR
jgi:MYXO-CTERM domain-containing protein